MRTPPSPSRCCGSRWTPSDHSHRSLQPGRVQSHRTQAADHDFQPDGSLTPFGLFLPDHDELNLYFTASKVTSDFIVDTLEEWWLVTQARFPQTRVLLLNLDNGPENHSHRSQFMYRLVRFAQRHRVTVRLTYYPPYHSKYNPIERCWGALENYWRGELLDSEAAILGYASRMTYRGVQPQVQRCQGTYAKGVKRSAAEQRRLEQYLERLPGLGRGSLTYHRRAWTK